MKRAIFCLLALIVSVCAAKDADRALLIDKTWRCVSTSEYGDSVYEEFYKKDGTFTAKGKTTIKEDKKTLTLEGSVSGVWTLKGDRLAVIEKTAKYTSKEKPEFAAMVESARQTSIKEGEAAETATIIELTKTKMIVQPNAQREEGEALQAAITCTAK
jgi:hypothetical protein